MGIPFGFRGLMAPVFTPFNEDRTLNLSVIPKYAHYLIQNGIQGVLVNGTTGEGVSMTVDERKAVLESWMKNRKDLTVMVQVGGTNLTDVKDLAEHAERLEVDAILCLPDLFFKPSTVDDLIRYLKMVSAHAPRTPLLYYHIPSYTGVHLSMRELLVRSPEIRTLVGIKYTDDDLKMGRSCVTKDLEDRVVFLGSDTLFLQALRVGFNSAIGTSINIFPTLNREILDRFHEKNYDSAEVAQQHLNKNILGISKQGSWVSSMKAAMRQKTSIQVGPVRDPLVNVILDD